MVVADIRGEAGAMSAPALVESAETAPMRSASGSADAYHGWTEALLYPINVLGDVLLVAALLGELVLVLLNVGARIVIDHSFLWTDEVARFALSILAFVGGAVAYRRHEHAFVRVALNLLPKRGERICLAFADAMVFFVSGITGIASIEFLASSWSERTPILQMPAALIGTPLPLGMAMLMLYAFVKLQRNHGKLGYLVLLCLGTVLGLAAVTQDAWLPYLGDEAPIIAALTLFFVFILMGVPVGFVLLFATAAYLWATGSASLVVLPQTMVNGIGNFILLAVPFFILAGLIMERGGISVRLVRFIFALVGHVRGGLLQVTVGSMYVVSGLSGSKPADVAAVGTVMRDELAEHHGAPEGAAVLAASAVMGETIPPSIAMLIVGSITNVSVAAMFIGGIIPAAVIASCLSLMIYFRGRRSGAAPSKRASLKTIADAGIGAILPLFMPGLLLAGILLGIATPTEIAAAAVIYGLLLAVLVYRKVDLPAFIKLTIDAAALTGVLLFIFAAASGFSWVLTIAYLPQRLVALLQSVGGSAAIFMLLSIVLLIVVGVLLEGLPSLNVLAPLLIPIAGKLGISELHYALVLIIAMGVGGFMPFAGVGFYVCCAVMRCDIEAASRAMLPYLIVVLTGLLVVAFVPWFTLFLPRYFGFLG
jgi:tripartite ATP-independent transporter DctM subunit